MGTERSVWAKQAPIRRPRHLSLRWTLLAVALAGVAVLVFLWDWNWFRPLVEHEALVSLGRKVTLSHFDLRPGRQTIAIADGVEVANPDGFPSDKPFATIERLSVTVDLWAYLHDQQIVVPSIVVDRPMVVAERPAGQQPNWILQAPGVSSGPPPKIGDIQINDGRATVVVPAMKSDFAIDIATTDPDRQGERRIQATAKGTYAKQPITGQLLAGALLSLRDPSRPYPIDLKVQNGPVHVSLVGTVQDPLAFTGADLKLVLAGPDMGLLYPLTGIPLPKTPPFQVTGDLDYSAAKIVFRHIVGKVGSSDLEGDVVVDPHRPRPLMTADMRSRQVDLADLGGFIGSQPGRMSTPNQTPQQKADLARAEASPQLLPTKPIDLPTLRSADMHLKYEGAHIIGKGVPFDRIATTMAIDDGRIRLDPLSVGVGQGQIAGTIDLTPLNDKQIRLHSDIGVQRVDLGRLMQAAGIGNSSGTIGGRAAIDSTGNSVATFAANGNGSVQLVMSGGGELRALLIDLSGLEFGNSLLSALGIPRNDQIQCFVGDWALRQGMLSTRTLILDTDRNVVTGTGDVNLKDETLDYRLKTDAKHFSIGTVPTPIAITGRFKTPSIRPEALPLVARGGVAAALGFLFPPAALLPTIQFGVGDDSHCAPPARRK
jgi:uncharacterized protein involved in outer membrane biogenesis